MNRIRWIAFCISGVAILTFTQYPYAAPLQTWIDSAAAEMNYNATVKSKLHGEISSAMEISRSKRTLTAGFALPREPRPAESNKESFMNIDRRWMLLIAVTLSAAIGAAVASRARRQHLLAARESEHKYDLKAWESEGGNLAPIPTSTVQLAVHS